MAEDLGGYVAPWWRDDDTGEGEVKAHTPDPTAYHPVSADSKYGSQLQSGPGGVKGAIIPRARSDGSSRGFDHERSGTVIVDPDSPGGGTVVDYSKLTNARIRSAIMTVGGEVGYGRETDRQTAHVMALLGKPVADATDEELTPAHLRDSVPVRRPGRRQAHAATPVNDRMPGSYVTPRANTNGNQIYHQPDVEAGTAPVTPVAPVAPVTYSPAPPPPVTAPPYEDADYDDPVPIITTATNTAMTPATATVTVVPQPVRRTRRRRITPVPEETTMPAPAQPQDPAALLHQLAAQMGFSLKPATTPAAPPPARRQRESVIHAIPAADVDVDDDQPEHRSQPANPFESLMIGFITGAKAVKPSRGIVFDLGDSGTISKKYHAVIKGNECLVLVYDTRYEDGEQWMPPVRKEPITVHLVARREEKTETFTVASIGTQFNLGCLDVVVLILAEADIKADLIPGEQF